MGAANRNTITLKGSTKTVTEFFGYAVNRCCFFSSGSLHHMLPARCRPTQQHRILPILCQWVHGCGCRGKLNALAAARSRRSLHAVLLPGLSCITHGPSQCMCACMQHPVPARHLPAGVIPGPEALWAVAHGHLGGGPHQIPHRRSQPDVRWDSLSDTILVIAGEVLLGHGMRAACVTMSVCCSALYTLKANRCRTGCWLGGCR